MIDILDEKTGVFEKSQEGKVYNNGGEQGRLALPVSPVLFNDFSEQKVDQ